MLFKKYVGIISWLFYLDALWAVVIKFKLMYVLWNNNDYTGNIKLFVLKCVQDNSLLKPYSDAIVSQFNDFNNWYTKVKTTFFIC